MIRQLIETAIKTSIDGYSAICLPIHIPLTSLPVDSLRRKYNIWVVNEKEYLRTAGLLFSNVYVYELDYSNIMVKYMLTRLRRTTPGLLGLHFYTERR